MGRESKEKAEDTNRGYDPIRLALKTNRAELKTPEVNRYLLRVFLAPSDIADLYLLSLVPQYRIGQRRLVASTLQDETESNNAEVLFHMQELTAKSVIATAATLSEDLESTLGKNDFRERGTVFLDSLVEATNSISDPVELLEKMMKSAKQISSAIYSKYENKPSNDRYQLAKILDQLIDSYEDSKKTFSSEKLFVALTILHGAVHHTGSIFEKLLAPAYRHLAQHLLIRFNSKNSQSNFTSAKRLSSPRARKIYSKLEIREKRKILDISEDELISIESYRTLENDILRSFEEGHFGVLSGEQKFFYIRLWEGELYRDNPLFVAAYEYIKEYYPYLSKYNSFLLTMKLAENQLEIGSRVDIFSIIGIDYPEFLTMDNLSVPSGNVELKNVSSS